MIIKRLKEYRDLYQYDGIETCATCSLCSTACPVKIDTGNLTKHLRAEQLTSKSKSMANFVANNFSTTLNGVRFGLSSANFIAQSFRNFKYGKTN